MLDGILSREFSVRCESLIKSTGARIAEVRSRAEAKQSFLNEDLAKLLSNGLDINAYGRTEEFLAGMNLLSCYDFVVQSCKYILKQLSRMQEQGECPEECREVVASLMYAAARFSDLPELRDLRDIFQQKYGSCFEAFVNQMFVEKLSSRPPPKEKRLQVLQDIASEFSIKWDSKGFERRMAAASVVSQEVPAKSKKQEAPNKPLTAEKIIQKPHETKVPASSKKQEAPKNPLTLEEIKQKKQETKEEMMQRCRLERDKLSFKHYLQFLGRSITVDIQWRQVHEFLNRDLEEEDELCERLKFGRLEVFQDHIRNLEKGHGLMMGSTNLESIQVFKKPGVELKDSFLDEGDARFTTDEQDQFRKYIVCLKAEECRRDMKEFKQYLQSLGSIITVDSQWRNVQRFLNRDLEKKDDRCARLKLGRLEVFQDYICELKQEAPNKPLTPEKIKENQQESKVPACSKKQEAPKKPLTPKEIKQKQQETKERIGAGKELLEAKHIEEDNERKRVLALRKTEKEEEKRAREKIHQELEEDKAERRWNLGLPPEHPATVKPSAPPVEEKKEERSLKLGLPPEDSAAVKPSAAPVVEEKSSLPVRPATP